MPKEELSRVALPFNQSSVGLRINRQISTEENHFFPIFPPSAEAVQETKAASLCIQRVFFAEWLENTCCIPMGEGLYSAEFDTMPCCLLARVSSCATTKLTALYSRGKVFMKPPNTGIWPENQRPLTVGTQTGLKTSGVV